VARTSLLRNADHAFDAPDHASDDTTHNSANDSANRTGGPLTHGYTLLASANDALGLRGHGRRKRGNDDSHGELHLHEQPPLSEICSFNDDGFSLTIVASARGECGY
jgi:hypothetical protein